MTKLLTMTIHLHSANIAHFDAKQAIHIWNLHHNRRPNFMETCRRRAMPETQTVEETLGAAADGQADDADEAVITSGSDPGSHCHS